MSHTYVIGLPVTVTVEYGGRVTYMVDLSEASDLSVVEYEDAPHLTGLEAFEAEMVIRADEQAIQRDVSILGAFRLTREGEG